MQYRWRRTIINPVLHWFAAILVAGYAGGACSAAEIRLKNGTTLRGNLLVMNSLSTRAVGTAEMKQHKDEDPLPRNIGRIDAGWQRIFFPLQQRQASDGKADPGQFTPLPVTIPVKPKPQRQGNLTVASFGSITFVDAFTEFGRRRVTIVTPKGPLNVFQAITEVAPDHMLVESTNCDWKLGLSPKSIPIETLEKLLQKQIKRDDPVGRFALVRFYSQAELYAQAFSELEAISRDFPDKKDLVEKSQEELMNYFGREVLRRLGRRKRTGQHVLAESMAKKLLTQSLTGPVLQDVQQYVRTYEQTRQTIERVKLILGDWQAKLDDADLVQRLQDPRSEINEQLDFDTLPRLDAFVKAESDKQYSPSQRLGLAYSGWALGPANAIPDLDQALRAWDARHSVLDYLRSDDPSVQSAVLQKLQSMENIGPRLVLNLAAQLPPVIEPDDVSPGDVHHVEGPTPEAFSYSVVLPAEYSPHHSYPTIIALRPRNKSVEQTIMAWAGNAEQPDFANQRGYIVIAPDYAEKTQGEHTYGAPAHKFVLDCLIDARKRFAVDSERVFLAGHGMGADAAFDIGMAHPDEFAGVLPIGGNALNYCTYAWENGCYTAWYVIGKGYDSNGVRDNSSNQVFDNIMKYGNKFDFMLVEFMGRNGENMFDDFSKIFDWMDVHVRQGLPKKFEVRSLRKTDNRFFWVTAEGLPRDYILPAAAGAARKVIPMEIEVRVTPGNTLYLKSATENYTLRLTPELVDFDKPLVVRVGGHVKHNQPVKPEISVLLEELRIRGDRKRLPLAVVQF
jgi:pimeloyl-ACP methyl ester carboxylesterase